MLSKFKQKSKKGFTLVELIVVIAIIAILAAVAIPTTMHFVDKAKISDESSSINYTSNINGMFTTVLEPGKEINITDAGASGSFKAALFNEGVIANTTAMYSIKFTVESKLVDGAIKYYVSYLILGQQYREKSQVSATVPGSFTAASIFKGVNFTTDPNQAIKDMATAGKKITIDFVINGAADVTAVEGVIAALA